MSALGRGTILDERAFTGVPPRVALGQALGIAMAAYTLGIASGVIGVLHHGAWIAVMAAGGIVATTWMAVKTYRWYSAAMTNPSEATLSWWRHRGLWLMLICEVPVWVSIGCLAVALHPRPS
jgi:hypothetical protein